MTKRKLGCIIIYVNAMKRDIRLAFTQYKRKKVRDLFQKNEFRAEVVRNGMSLEDVAKAIGINYVSLHRKMNGTSDFYRGEIEKIISLLNLSGEDVLRIFFAK